ncbi:MAG: hypothetical protein LBQ66_02070 [Planctomycetaceae bacterium]|jgi:hypothetical protein|nr:hypothetical protein [Planctomycetaceae bacterium]
MYFLFSGEGETDLGIGKHEGLCEGDDYLYGPLALFVDQIVFEKFNYHPLESSVCIFVPKKQLKQYFDQLKPLKKFKIPRGEVKYEQGTKYFRNNARALAVIAKKIGNEKNDENVIAILFRDSDRKNSSEPEEWEKKRDSMINGFLDENFTCGVPMIPKPVSEAWILCAIYRAKNPVRNCDDLENTKHGNQSEHALKIELENELNEQPTRELLNEKITNKEINVQLINLPSFNQFKVMLDCKL